MGKMWTNTTTTTDKNEQTFGKQWKQRAAKRLRLIQYIEHGKGKREWNNR